MKIDVIKRRFISHGSHSFSYKIDNIRPCCDQLINNPIIDFCYTVTENTDNPIEEDDYGFDVGVMLEENLHYDDDGYGYDEQRYYKIKFCPFCGEKITVNVVATANCTERYEALDAERYKVHIKYCKTDSKKRSEELLAQRNLLDKQINDLYMTDRFANYFEEREETNEN